MSTTAEYYLHVALVLLFSWAGKATAETRKFTLNQPDARNLGVWRLTHDPVIRDEGNYHNIQCWSPNGRYTCYTHWGGDDGPGGKGSAEVHVVDLKTGEDRLVEEGVNPRWASQHNWLFYSHYTGDGRPPYETGTQVIRYDADTGEKVVIAHGIECPGGTDSTDTWLYGTQRFRGRKPEFVLTGPDKARAQPDAVMLRAGIAEDNPLLYQRQTNCYVVVVRLPFPPHLRKKGNRVELIPGEHHWETRGFRILRDGKPIREELFAPGDSFTLAQPGTHTAVAVEQSGIESPPSLPLGIVKPVEGEVLRDKPEDFSWTRELWQVAGKSVSRKEAKGGARATMALAHLHDGTIAREQWENGRRVSRVDLNEDGKPIRQLEFENGKLRKRTYQTAEGYLASEEFYGPDGYKIAHIAYYTREDRRGQESYQWQYNQGQPIKKTYRGKVVYED